MRTGRTVISLPVSLPQSDHLFNVLGRLSTSSVLQVMACIGILCSRLLLSGHHCLWHLLHSFLLFGVNLTVSVSFAIPFRNFSNSSFMISTNELVLASFISSLISLMVSYLCFLKAASARTSSSVHQLHLLTASEAWNTTLGHRATNVPYFASENEGHQDR